MKKTTPTPAQITAWREARIQHYADTRSPESLARMLVELEDVGEHVPEFDYRDEWPGGLESTRVK